MSNLENHPNRRAVLVAASATIAVGSAGRAFGQANADQGRAGLFASARARDPRLAAFENGRETHVAKMRIEGAIPRGLAGAFYRNGPAMFDRGGVRYRHWFDGDGFIQRWRIQGQQVSYTSRFVQTPKFAAEQQAGTFVLPVSGGGIAPAAAFTGPNSANPANTSIIQLGEMMWALWEGGSAMGLDPETLDARGFVRFGTEVDAAPFSAHPRRGEDGRIWNVGSLGQRVILYRLDATGRLEHFRLQPLGGEGYYHDFLLTRRSLVVIQCSTETRGERSLVDGSFGSMRGVADKPMRMHIFDRETFDRIGESELPSGFAFHFGNAWEEEDGSIAFDIIHDADADQMLEFFKPMTGSFPSWRSNSYRVYLPRSGAPRFELLQARTEFPKINPAFETRRNRYVYAPTFLNPHSQGWFDSIVRIDLEQGRHQTFHYGEDWMVEEHLFVAKPGSTREDDGWLIGTAFNWLKQQSALTMFDAARPDQGFLARAWLEAPAPLGLHGTFRAG